MGTRGFIGLVVDGQEKIAYNHFDSYPDGVGAQFLEQVRELVKDPELPELARRLRLVDEEAQPSADDVERLKQYWDPRVSTGSAQEWYSLLRNLQGDIAQTLLAGVMIDSSLFPVDSLFCEWGYLVDLDKGVLEVYRGFQKRPPTAGRWEGRPTPEEVEQEFAELQKKVDQHDLNPDYLNYKKANYYYAVQLVAEWSLDDLPETDEFVARLEREN